MSVSQNVIVARLSQTVLASSTVNVRNDLREREEEDFRLGKGRVELNGHAEFVAILSNIGERRMGVGVDDERWLPSRFRRTQQGTAESYRDAIQALPKRRKGRIRECSNLSKGLPTVGGYHQKETLS